MIDFRPEQIANLIQRSPEFASLMKIQYPDLVPDIVSFVLNPDCSCKKRLIRFAKRKNTELTEMANKFLEENQGLQINLEAVFKNQPIQETRVRKEMDLSPEQIAFLNERKKRVEEKRALNETPAPVPTQQEIKKDVENIKKSVKEVTPASPRNLAGEVIEIEPQPAAYKKMLKYIQENKWTFDGLSVLETEKFEEGATEPTVIWLVFFY